MRRFLAVLAVLTALVFALSSCGGSKKEQESNTDDSDDTGRKQGELYGECYPNETCNKGLICDEENNICIKDPGSTEEPDEDSDDADTSDPEIPDDDSDTDIPVTPDEDNDHDTPETPDADSDSGDTIPDHDTDSDTDDPEETENHKISGLFQIGSSVSNIKAALFECGKTVELATANTDANGKFSFQADISASKTYCVKANGFSSCFKGMSDHVANISEITNAVYLVDSTCTDIRKSETAVRLYTELGTGRWLGELDYSKLSGISEGLKLLSSFLNTSDSKTLSQKIAADVQKTDGREFEKFFNGFRISADKKEVVIDTVNANNNEVSLNVEGGSSVVADGFKIIWTALNTTTEAAVHKFTSTEPGEYLVRAKLVDDGGDPIMISEDSSTILFLLEKLNGTIDVSDMSKDISHYIDNGIYAVIPKNTVVKKGNNKVNTLTYKVLTTGDGSQISKIDFGPEGTTFSGDSMYFVYELGTVFGGDPIMLSATRTNSDGSSNVLESSGGDPIMLAAGGDPIMFSAGGDPIMQIARSAGGDPIMMSAGGDPIMMDAGGDPIMSAAGGDPIMSNAAGDPIMSTAAGDPIMMGTSSSVMIAKTDHFSGFHLNSNSLPRSVDDLIEKWCRDSYYKDYNPVEFIRRGVEKFKPAGADKDKLLSYLTCQNFGKLESDLYELINRPLGYQRNLNLFENIFYISEFHNRLKIKKTQGEKAAVRNGLDLKSAIAALYTSTTSFNRSSTTADSFNSSMIPMTYSGSTPADYSADAQKAVTGLTELNQKYVATKKELMIFANYITTSSKGPDFDSVLSPLNPDQLVCAWFNPDIAPQSCNKVYTLNANGHVAAGGTEVSVEEANEIFSHFFMPFNSRLSNPEKLNLFRTFFLVLRYAGTLFHGSSDVETMNDELLETAYMVFDGINQNVNAVSIIDTFDASAHTVQVLEDGEMETKPYLTKLASLTDKISLNVANPANVVKVLIKTEGYEYDRITENTRTYYKPKGELKENSIILTPGNLEAGEKPLKELIGSNNVDALGNIVGKMTVVVNSTISGKTYTTQKTYEFLINDNADGVDSKPIPSNLTVFLYDSNENPIAENKNPGIILNPGNMAFYPNADGLVTITDLAPASYTIDAFADGYYAKNVGVNIPENATLSVEIRLDEVVTNSAEAELTVKVNIDTTKHPDKVYLQIYDEDMNLVANEAAKFSDELNTYEDVNIDINFGRFTLLAVGEEMYNYVETITVNNENTIKEITVVAKNACGNGIVDSGEECEATGSEEPEEVNCGDIYPASTNPENKTRCNAATCVYDKTGCGKAAYCGDGIVDLGEGCDGGTKDCSEILGTSAKGTVPCAANCSDWLSADNCTRTLNNCTNLPENAVWNDGIGRFTQTYDGSSWLPASMEGTFGTTRSECTFSCVKGYKWDAVHHECIEAALSLGNICTGQTACFDSSTITAECPAYGKPFFGQDAQYAAAGFCTKKSFKTTGTGSEPVIVDNYTHFEWHKAASDEAMTWSEADNYCMQSAYANNGEIADWRLPTPQELLTIVDNAALAGIFTATENSTFWATEDVKNNANAWKLGENGELISVDKTTTNFVICIRQYNKETTTDRFTEDAETVTDNESNLIWQKNPASPKNWQEALEHCENLSATGHYDWRLPNRNELASIIDFTKTSGAASGLPNIPPQVFWTSTSSKNAADKAWAVNFADGSINETTKYETKSVICVRSENICLGDESNCTNACKFEPCGEIEHSTGFCTSSGGSFYCGCKSGFSWNMINATCGVEETRYAACEGLPENAKWNTVSGISQILAGDDWYPESIGKYNENPSIKECHFICEGYFEWDSDTKECVNKKQITLCGLLPYAHTEWTGDNYIIQTWNGLEWLPRVELSYNEEPAENKCRFKCAVNYNWNGSNSCDAATNENLPCTGLPSGAKWNATDKITQTWNGSAWTPSSEGEYNEEASTEECRFKCQTNHFWNGEECVNPCDANPCETGTCIPQSDTAYYCGCQSGYRWNGYECEKMALGNICTDQTQCYDYVGRLFCPTDEKAKYFGQDAQYATLGTCFAHDYNDSENLTTFDNNTGLLWQKGYAVSKTWQAAESYCSGLNLNGVTGWRVPTPVELVSIIDKSMFEPAIDRDYFDFTGEVVNFWSSQELNSDDTKAWNIDLSQGTLGYADKGERYAVRCVKGSQYLYTNKFLKSKTYNSDLVIIDESTHLIWKQNLDARSGSWKAALKSCENLNYAGYSDWRLPNINELLSIANYETSSPATNFPKLIKEKKYWSSTSSDKSAKAMVMDFEKGEILEAEKDGNAFMICVRSSTCNDSDCVNACVNNPCNNIDHSDNVCTPEDEERFSCGCEENYIWNGSTCVNPCDANPCNSVANSTGVCIPENDDAYSCECNENYFWNNGECSLVPGSEPEPIPTSCDDNPCDNIDHSTGICLPKNDDSYKCECEHNYFWNGETCVNPCDAHPCENFENTIGECNPRAVDMYVCGCNEGYYWWGKLQGCTAQPHNIGTICTGQTKCLNNNYYNPEIECPEQGEDFFGQDATYANSDACLPHNFSIDTSVEGENIVIDKNTGLQWQQTLSTNNYTWNDAVAYCENLNYGGYTDWRLPTPNEILTIADISKNHPAVDKTYFVNIPGDPYTDAYFWTSKSYSSSSALRFYSSQGGIYYDSKSYTYHAMCVRGNELPTGSFTILTALNGDITVTDSRTGLMWQKTYVSKRWEETLEYCENLDYAGYTDWRLPNKNELASLLNHNKSASPYSDFPDMPSASFCSSTATSIDAWCVNFGNGYEILNFKTEDHYIRCVRSDICGSGKFWNGSECLNNPCQAGSCNHTHETGNCQPRTSSTFECTCEDNYFWNGSECVSPCDANSCGAHSDGNCIALSPDVYYCGCEDRYSWNAGECKEYSTGLTLGNICTGLDECYNSKYSSVIICPAAGEDFFGQDAQYAASGSCTAQSFTVVDTGIANQKIVLDNNTGLEWQQTLSANSYNWNDAYIYCDTLSYGGYTDWRLPTPNEFLTIADNSKYDPAADMTYFVNIPSAMPSSGSSSAVWTSKTYDSIKAFLFSPYYGRIDYISKTNMYRAMCVRGSKLPTGLFASSTAENGDITVTDSASGLIWQKTYVSGKTWQQALEYCETLDYARYTDWRLPNKNELASLLNHDKSTAPYSDFPDIPSQDFWLSFWSSSTKVEYTSSAWYVNFNYGNVNSHFKDSNYNVRCVRSDICENGKFWNGSSCVNPCDSNLCADIEHSNGTCTATNATNYSCGCEDGYSWNGTSCDEMTNQVEDCTGLPANAQWNTASSITQNWNGSSWQPSTIGVYNENPSSEECRFKCYTNYFWNGSNCLARTQTVNCELPRGAQYNTASSITQTWNGSVWVPSATPTYNEEASTTECRYICKSDYDWDELTQRCVTKGDTRTVNCTDLPAHASYNTVSSIEQTYDDLDQWGNVKWEPSNTTTYSETPSTTNCYFKCDDGFTYDGSSMCVTEGDTKTVDCTGLPTNAEWNTVSSITQTWNGTEWTPSNTGNYDETPSTTECRFKCNKEYSYDGSKCVTVGNTQTINCTGLPTGAQWNTVSSITQTWNGSVWTPAVDPTGSYNEIPSTTECRYICKEHYSEDNGQCVADSQPAYCDEKPENSVWNDDGANGAYTQTWSGSAWSPSYTTSYDETAGACHFTCLSGYIWNSVGCINPCDYCGEHSNGLCTILSTTEYSCGCVENYGWNATTLKCEGNTQTYTCTGKPANSSWNSVSSYTQTWEGSVWTPAASEATYNEEASTTECRFKCNTNYFWNGSACINVCDENPCNGKANSTKVCKPTSATEYICGCNNSYFWNGSQCEDIHNMPECTSSSNTPCTNSAKTLIWSSKSDTTVLSSEATAYCDEFFEGGFEDWSLPTIGELRTLVQNCPATETGGSCGVTDSCLLSSCRDSSCDGCASGSAVYSQLGDTETLLAKNTAYWNIDFTTAKINKSSLLFANIRCVRPGICEFGETWNGSACASPCDGNPCAGIEHSNGTCTATSATEYSCGCANNYYWNTLTLKCEEKGLHCGDGIVQEEYGETCEPSSFSSSTCYKPTSEESCGNCGGQVISKYATYQSACNTCGLTWKKISSEDAETDCGGEVPEPRCEF